MTSIRLIQCKMHISSFFKVSSLICSFYSCTGASSWHHCVQKCSTISWGIYLQWNCDCSDWCTNLFCKHELHQRQVLPPSLSHGLISLPYLSCQSYWEHEWFFTFLISQVNKYDKINFFRRLREYEIEVDRFTGRGPDVERVYFVIIEMARKFIHPSTFVEFIKCI